MRSFKKTTRQVCIFNFSSVKYQFYIHFQNNYLLGGSSTRPPIGSLPVVPIGWLPSPRIPSPLRQSIPQSYRTVDATAWQPGGPAAIFLERTLFSSELSTRTVIFVIVYWCFCGCCVRRQNTKWIRWSCSLDSRRQWLSFSSSSSRRLCCTGARVDAIRPHASAAPPPSTTANAPNTTAHVTSHLPATTSSDWRPQTTFERRPTVTWSAMRGLTQIQWASECATAEIEL